MKFSQFHQKIRAILDVDLPSGSSMADEGRRIAADVNISRTAFMDEMDNQKVTTPVVMGGVLNQKVENQPLPIDVTTDIKKLGIQPCPRLQRNFSNLLDFDLKDKEGSN